MIVQDEAFLYNDDIKQGIKDMSYSTNILEKYDNVTYNACLYMFPYEVEQQIQRKLGMDTTVKRHIDRIQPASQIDLNQYANKRVIIAQTGVTTKFSIKNFDIETTYGVHGSADNIISFKINLDLFESLSCLFANEMEVLSSLMGYNSYLLRPVWFEVWFSGYDTESLQPVPMIPLSNGDNKLIYRCTISKAVSNIESMGTNWKLEMYSSNITFEDKNKSVLARCPVMKSSTNMTIGTYLDKLFKNVYDRYVDKFTQEDIKKEIKTIYPNGVKSFIEYIVVDEYGNDLRDVIVSETVNRDVDADGSNQEKDDPESTLSDVIQRFVCRSKTHKNAVARVNPESIYLESFGTYNFYKHYVTIVVEKDEFLEYLQEKWENKDSDKDVVSIQSRAFWKSRESNALIKKYCYGFSGEDTSVISVDNSFDRLWYMNAIQLSAAQQSTGVINLVAHRENDIKNSLEKQFSVEEYIKTFLTASGTLSDKITAVYNKLKEERKQKQIEENKKIYNEEHPYAGYMEDIYQAISYDKDFIDAARLIAKINVLNNDLDVETTNSSTSSDSAKAGAEMNNSYNIFQGFYKLGQMVTTKVTIMGDPYWITPISENRFSSKNVRMKVYDYPDELKSNSPLTDVYRFVFGIKSFIGQSDDYQTPYDYDLWEYSLNATGIYIIYNCKSTFADGKFTQVLSGSLDMTLVDDYEKYEKLGK